MADGQASDGQRVVVIGVDKSEWSERAFDWYMSNVHRSDDQIIIVHVDEPAHPPVAPNAMASEEWQERMEHHQEKVDRVKDKYKTKATELKLKARIQIKYDNNVGHSICRTVKDEHGTMIVIGSRGAGVVRRTILGSVSDYVIHHSHVPVLVCPKPHSHHSPFHSPIFGRKGSPKHERLQED